VALTEDWAPKAESLFDVTVSESANIPEQRPRTSSGMEQPVSERIGHIVLKPRYSFLKSDLGILPFRTQVQVAGKSLRFWSYANKITDQPFPDKLRSPQTWEALIDACWDTAREQIILFALNSHGASTPQDIELRSRDISDLKRLLQGQRPEVKSWIPEELRYIKCNWLSKDPRDWAQLFALSRILIALFGNCLQHGDPLSPIEVAVERTKYVRGNEYKVQIANRLRCNPIAPPPDFLISSARLRELMGFLNAAKGISKAINRLQEGSTPDVVRASLADLDGELLTLGPHTGRVNFYLVSCSFRWSISDGV
jgi:hypothetical protein